MVEILTLLISVPCYNLGAYQQVFLSALRFLTKRSKTVFMRTDDIWFYAWALITSSDTSSENPNK